MKYIIYIGLAILVLACSHDKYEQGEYNIAYTGFSFNPDTLLYEVNNPAYVHVWLNFEVENLTQNDKITVPNKSCYFVYENYIDEFTLGGDFLFDKNDTIRSTSFSILLLEPIAKLKEPILSYPKILDSLNKRLESSKVIMYVDETRMDTLYLKEVVN